MGNGSPVSDNEIILRRVTKHPSNVQKLPGGGLRATSFAIRPRFPGDSPSWSRKRFTAPPELLAIEERKGRDVSGWSIVALRVSDVRALGLDVKAVPTDDDPGHCLVIPTERQGFRDSLWSKLAKRTRVVYPKEL